MKREMIQYLACPECRSDLQLAQEVVVEANGEIKEGEMRCPACQRVFPIKNYIPRFVASENYAESFGLEWNAHAKTQIDKFSGTNITRERFYEVTNWPIKMEKQKILEAGCGAGRFTQIAIETGAEVFSFDLSTSVDASLDNNGLLPNLHIFQADIYHIPLKQELFDKIFCFGVLQHCPNVRQAFISLIPYLKDGGEVVIDVSRRSWTRFTQPFWWLRHFTTRLSPPFLHRIAEKTAPILQPIKIFVKEVPWLGRYLGILIPVVDYQDVFPLTKEQNLDWGILDTFDALSAKYSQAQRIGDVREWFSEAGLVNVEVGYGPNGINGRGMKPRKSGSTSPSII